MLGYKNDHEIYGLQILKLICAFFVVQIHFNSVARLLLSPIVRIAVPVFFMITGYFLISKDGTIQSNKVRITIFKLIKLYIFVTIIYLLYQFLCIRDWTFFQKFTHLSFWVSYLFIGTMPGFHLWYIISLIESLIIIYIGNKLKFNKLVFVIIPLCLLLNFVFGKYNFLFGEYGIPNDLILSRNTITFGIPFILIGILIRRYEYKLPSTRTIYMLMFLAIVGLYMEYILLKMKTGSIGDLFCFNVPVAVLVFMCFLRFNPNTVISFKLAKYGKYYSTDIYLWHILVASILSILLNRIFQGMPLCGYFDAFIVFGTTMCFAIMLRHFKINRFYK